MPSIIQWGRTGRDLHLSHVIRATSDRTPLPSIPKSFSLYQVQARRITKKAQFRGFDVTVAVRVTVLAVATPATATSRLAGVDEPLTVVITKSFAVTPFTVTARDPGAPTGTTASPAYTIINPLPD